MEGVRLFTDHVSFFIGCKDLSKNKDKQVAIR